MNTLKARLAALELKFAPKAQPMLVIFDSDDEATERAKFIAARGVQPGGTVVIHRQDARVQPPEPADSASRKCG